MYTAMNDKPPLEVYSLATIDACSNVAGVELSGKNDLLAIDSNRVRNGEPSEIEHTRSENGQPRQSAMIDLAHTRFIVTAWPDHRWALEIWTWIEALMRDVKPAQHDYRTSVKKQNVVCARNWAIKHEALGSHRDYQWFVFIDKDVRPRKGMETARFLTIDADVKSCQVDHGDNKSAYSWPDDFHEPIWCTSRKVLETIEPPWFMQKYNVDGTEMDGCICTSFRTKVLEAGFTIAHGGWADHDRDGSWCG